MTVWVSVVFNAIGDIVSIYPIIEKAPLAIISITGTQDAVSESAALDAYVDLYWASLFLPAIKW
jgi:hypothetical protein